MNMNETVLAAHARPWDYALVDNHTFTRPNKTLTWSYGLDKEENYKVNIIRPKYKKEVTYKPEDFSYTFNSMGIRCDELEASKCEILYAGCSFTEGEGLPVEHIWASQLNKMIMDEFGIELGYHNVGRGGLSSSGIVRKVYQAIEVLKLRPKMVVALFPSIFRTEVFLDNWPDVWSISPMDYVPNYVPTFLPKEHKFYMENMEQNMRLMNSLNEFYKNAILLEAICSKHGIDFRFHSWQGAISRKDLPSDDLKNLPKKYFNGKALDMINLGELIIDYMPENIKDKYLDVQFRGELFLPEKPFKQTIGRDYAHPGPNCHYYFAKGVFNKIKPELIKLYEKDNQHQGPECV
jgi:hypothetical protein